MVRIGSIVAALALVAACTPQGSEGTPAPGDAAVEVTLDSFSIELPDSVGAGTVSFQVANVGDMAHTFAIEGSGLSEELAEPIQPNGSATLTVELAPGTYTVWCPIGDHRERGMEATIEVTEGPPPSDGAPLGDEAVGPSEQEAPITDDYTAP